MKHQLDSFNLLFHRTDDDYINSDFLVKEAGKFHKIQSSNISREGVL